MIIYIKGTQYIKVLQLFQHKDSVKVEYRKSNKNGENIDDYVRYFSLEELKRDWTIADKNSLNLDIDKKLKELKRRKEELTNLKKNLHLLN